MGRPQPAVAPAAVAHERPLPASAQFLLLALAAVVALLFVGMLALPLPRAAAGWAGFAILAALVLASDRLELYAGRSYDVRVATAAMVAGALLLPPSAVMACGACFALHRLAVRLPLRERIFNGCAHALGGLAAWGVGLLVLGDAARTGTAVAVAGLSATVVYVVCAWSLLVAILHLARDLALGDLRRQLPGLLVAELGLGALGTVVAYLWVTEPVLVPLAVAPLVLTWLALRISSLREAASVDPKTGLFNARHLRQALAAEIDRATRYGRPLSLLLVDLDFLRTVNNTHGHLAGDAVLVGIGDVLRGELRSMDVPARFGGEEFCVLLPETSGRRAVLLAERIRRRVAERRFELRRGAPPIHVTCSIGVAAFPVDARGDDELIDAADAAVYDAKARGRNRVCVAGEQVLAAGHAP